MPRIRTAASEDRVDEWGDRAALGQHDQASEEREHHEDREQPELLPHPHERPELGDEAHSRWLRTGSAWYRAPAPAAAAGSSSSARPARGEAAGDPSRARASEGPAESPSNRRRNPSPPG